MARTNLAQIAPVVPPAAVPPHGFDSSTWGRPLLFTVGALLIYRLGTAIPLPFVNHADIAHFRHASLIPDIDDRLPHRTPRWPSMLDLDIWPYVIATGIMMLLTLLVPKLRAKRRDAQQRKTFNQYARYMTIGIAAVQAHALIPTLLMDRTFNTSPAIHSWAFYIGAMSTLVGGAIFLMWLADQISSRGIGHGVTMIVAANIAASLRGELGRFGESYIQGHLSLIYVYSLLILLLLVIAAGVCTALARRRLLISHRRAMADHLAIKLSAPCTTALALTFAAMVSVPKLCTPSLLAGLVFGSTLVISWFASTATEFAERLQRTGGFLPGRRQGAQTAAYIDGTRLRLAVIAALLIVLIMLLAHAVASEFGLPQYVHASHLLFLTFAMVHVREFIAPKQDANV
jgi:preprotein translocase subunit SecY